MVIVISLLIEIITGMIILHPNEVNEPFSLICVSINTLLIFFLIFKTYKKYSTVLILAYFLRLFLLFADYYKLFPIIHSGADTEAFHAIAVYNAKNGLIIMRLTNYSTIVSIFYFIIGPQRLFVQYINLLCGMGSIFFIIKTLDLLKVEKNTKILFVSIACFLPHFIIFSSIFLRESLIIFATAVSVYFYIRWFLSGKITVFILSCLFVLLAVWLHSGMIGCLLGYLIGYSLYDRKSKNLKFNINSIIPIGIGCILLVFLISSGYFTEYFNGLLDSESEIDFLAGRFNHQSEGGSKYLTWISVENPLQMILFSPLKMFYFLFSPIPLDWRGINDVIGFCFSSFFLIYLTWISFTNLKYVKDKIEKNLVKILLISSFITIFIYGLGVFASGTAMRHRTKIISILIITAAISYNSTNKNKKRKINYFLNNEKNISNI